MKAYRNTMIAIAVIFVFSLVGICLNSPYYDKKILEHRQISEAAVHSANHELVASVFAYIALVVAVSVFIIFTVKNIKRFILKIRGEKVNDTYLEEVKIEPDRIFTDEEIAQRKKEDYIRRAYHHRK